MGLLCNVTYIIMDCQIDNLNHCMHTSDKIIIWQILNISIGDFETCLDLKNGLAQQIKQEIIILVSNIH